MTVLLVTSAGLAHALEEAERLFDHGNMLEAARLGEREGSADGLALAAKALLVEALYIAPERARLDLLDEAAEAARSALALEADHVDAMLRLAMSLGHRADVDDPVAAHMRGDAEEGRKLIERARRLAPEDAWTHGLLGIWHLQVVRHGGDALAASLYGASRDEGIRLCEQALTLDPGATAIRFGCARSLLDVDPVGYRELALAELGEVIAVPAEDAAGRLIREQAEALIRDLRLASR